MTPLHWAVETKKRDIVDILLKYGADPSATSKFFKTPMSIAWETNQSDVFQELLTWNMKIGDPEQQLATDTLVNEMKQEEAASNHNDMAGAQRKRYRQVSETKFNVENNQHNLQQQQNSIIEDFDDSMMIASSPDSSSQHSTVFSNSDMDGISKHMNCK